MCEDCLQHEHKRTKTGVVFLITFPRSMFNKRDHMGTMDESHQNRNSCNVIDILIELIAKSLIHFRELTLRLRNRYRYFEVLCC